MLVWVGACVGNRSPKQSRKRILPQRILRLLDSSQVIVCRLNPNNLQVTSDSWKNPKCRVEQNEIPIKEEQVGIRIYSLGISIESFEPSLKFYLPFRMARVLNYVYV